MGCSQSGYAETLAVNLDKQRRLFDRDIRRLQLTELEVATLFENDDVMAPLTKHAFLHRFSSLCI